LEVSGTVAKSPSIPNSPVASKSIKFFQKIGASRRQKHDTTASSESNDPLLLSYSKSYEEAAPGESENVFELQPEKKKKRKSLLRRNKVSTSRTPSTPAERIKSSDSDDKIHVPTTTDEFNNPWVSRALSNEMSAQRTAARSLDDLSAIPEINTNNNNTKQSTTSRSHHSTSPTKMWGVTKILKGKKANSSLQVNNENVLVKSAPSTPEKHRKKHYSFPSITGNTTQPKIVVNSEQQDTIMEGDHPVVTVKRRTSGTRYLHHDRHRSYDPEELRIMASNLIAGGKPNSDVVRTKSLNYGDKPRPYVARYKQQYPTSSPPIGSQKTFFSSSTMDSQESLNGVRQDYFVFVPTPFKSSAC